MIKKFASQICRHILSFACKTAEPLVRYRAAVCGEKKDQKMTVRMGVSREVTKDANSRAPIIQPLHVGDDSVSVEYVAES